MKMLLKAAIVCCLLATALAAEDKKRKAKRNLEYLSHHPPNYGLERRIAIGPGRYPQFFPQRSGYRRPQSVPAPPYAVPMEPLMQYSQRDPLYDPNLANHSDGNDLQSENNHLAENIYGKHVIERPVYIKEPEPIIEIIIKESNVTLPPPIQIPPTPKKKEQVQVFYVKYKKNPNGKGKDSIIYEKPVPAISPRVKDEEEVIHKPEALPELVTSAPPPSTTLRAIIKPESETFHAHKGIHITFGQQEKKDHDDENEESAPQPSISLPQEHRSFRTERQRVPQPYTPFEQGSQFGRRIPQFASSQSGPHPQGGNPQPSRPSQLRHSPLQINSQGNHQSHSQSHFSINSQGHSQGNTQIHPGFPQNIHPPQAVPPPQINFRPQTSFNPPQNNPPPPPPLVSHQIPRTPPFSQQLPGNNRPVFQNYNYFKQQSQVLIPPTNFRQPVPYQPFDQVKPQPPPQPNFPKPHPHFPIRPPHNQPPGNFNQNFPPQPISQFENGFSQQLPIPQGQINFNQEVTGQNRGQPHQEQLSTTLNVGNSQKLEFGPQFGQQFGPDNSTPNFDNFHRNQEALKQQQQTKSQELEFRRQPEFNQQKDFRQQQQQHFGHQQNQPQFSDQHNFQQGFRQEEHNKDPNQINPTNIIPLGGELIQSVPKYEQHYQVNSNGQQQKIQFPENQPQSLALQSAHNSQSQNILQSSQPHSQQNYLNPEEYRQKIQQQFQQQPTVIHQDSKTKSIEINTKQNEQFLRQFQQQHQQLPQLAQRQNNQFESVQSQQSFAEQQFKELIANHPRGPALLDNSPHVSTANPAERFRYESSTPTPKSTPTTTQPTTTTKDPKELNLQLPDEVPDDLRQQLLSSGILNNADISVLDYDKVGDIPLSALPPDQLANFYGAGGAAQLASGSAPIPSIVKPDEEDQEVEASEQQEVKVPSVEMKVVRYDPQTEEGKQIPKKYIKDDAKTTAPVELNESYNKYLPLKVSGAQFPIPDIPELKGKKISSVVVLAPVDYEFEKSRVTREASLDGLQFPKGSALKRLIDDPSKENYIKFLESENKTSANHQSVILLVTEPSEAEKEKEIFMYDVATQSVSKLSGELSSAFVDAADANSNDSAASASNLVEVRVPSPGNIDRSDDSLDLDMESDASEIVASRIPIIDPMEVELEPQGSENYERFVDFSGQDLSVSEENVKIESGYSKTDSNRRLL